MLLPILDRIEKDCCTEVIVSDGGSEDRTVETARSRGARIVVSSSPGWGVQMNTAAEAAGGSILLFLRAGSQLPENYASLIRIAEADPEISIGAFPILLEQKNPSLSPKDKSVTGYSRKRRLPWGKQELFIRKSLFRELGGFRDIPLLENEDLIRRAIKWGDLALQSVPVVSSLIRNAAPEGGRGRLRRRLVLMGWKLGLYPHLPAPHLSESSRPESD